MKNSNAILQGQFCKGQCTNYHCVLSKKGEKKYINNVRCTYCAKYMPKSMVVIVGVYHRCPCCNMKVRTKRFHSITHNEKEATIRRNKK